MKKLVVGALALLMSVSAFGSCNVTAKEEELKIVNTDMYTQEVRNYLSAEDEYEQIMALRAADIYDKQLTSISWEEQNSADTYVVVLSTDANMHEKREYTVDGDATEYTFNALIPGTKYYVKVQSFDGSTLLYETKVQAFTTQSDFCQRIVNVDGVSNVRDIGGYKAQGTSTVKYGMIYRGARLNAMTDDGITTFTQELGIKTELDVRYGTDGGKVVELAGVAYKQLGMWAYNSILPDTCQPKVSGAGLFDPRTIEGIKGVFETIANPSNLPVYIHCTAGADRTGTICYLINGVLGVEYSDLVQDFELTSFSEQGRRWRSSVKNWEFESEGVMQNDEKNFVAFGQMHSLMMQWYAPNGETLQTAIENYLTSVCGISMDTIGAVRENLLA